MASSASSERALERGSHPRGHGGPFKRTGLSDSSDQRAVQRHGSRPLRFISACLQGPEAAFRNASSRSVVDGIGARAKRPCHSAANLSKRVCLIGRKRHPAVATCGTPPAAPIQPRTSDSLTVSIHVQIWTRRVIVFKITTRGRDLLPFLFRRDAVERAVSAPGQTGESVQLLRRRRLRFGMSHPRLGTRGQPGGDSTRVPPAGLPHAPRSQSPGCHRGRPISPHSPGLRSRPLWGKRGCGAP